MNDPRMLNDPDMAGALDPVKKIHAAWLMQQDETARMSPSEKRDYRNKRAEIMGFPLCYDLAGQGKLKPRRQLVTQ
jgi:hypothetical protein